MMFKTEKAQADYMFGKQSLDYSDMIDFYSEPVTKSFDMGSRYVNKGRTGFIDRTRIEGSYAGKDAYYLEYESPRLKGSRTKYDNLYYHESDLKTVNRPLTRQEYKILNDVEGRQDILRGGNRGLFGKSSALLGIGLTTGKLSTELTYTGVSRNKRGMGLLDSTKKYTDIFTETKPRLDFFEETKSDTSTRTDTRTGSISLTDTITGQIQQTRQDLIFRTDTRLEIPTIDLTRRIRTTPPRPGPRETPPKIPRIPGLPGNQEETKTRITNRGREQIGYIPEVHERGRWIPLTKKTLTQREAKNFLAETLDQSKAAVGRLRPSKGKLQSLGINIKDFGTIARKFKEKDNLIIEKREYRIDSIGEKKQITALGHAQNRLKGRTNRTNMLGELQTNRILPTKIKRTKTRRTRYV
jgi:hypothetical protein